MGIKFEINCNKMFMVIMLSFWLWKGNDKRQAPHVIGATCDPGPLLISWSTTSNDDTIFVTQYSIQYMIQYMWCNVLVYLPPALSCLVYIKLWCTNSYRTSSNVLTWWGWGTLWSLEMSWMETNIPPWDAITPSHSVLKLGGAVQF